MSFPSSDYPAPWDHEILFFDGDAFFDALLIQISRATKVIKLESYIFEGDEVGEQVFSALCTAASRGVNVRVMVDGIGSPKWRRVYGERARRALIQFRVFHELPWERILQGTPPGAGRERIWKLFAKINNRNHRKVCIIDDLFAFVGSSNISAVHSVRSHGLTAWRDTAAEVAGSGVAVLSQSFEDVWLGRILRLVRFGRGRKRGRVRLKSPFVLLNNRRADRERNYLSLLRRIQLAKERIFVTNAYFIPHHSLLQTLSEASKRGVDVRLIVPKSSDIFFLPIVTAALREGMLRAGVRVFEYLPSMLHAKSIVIDNWCLVGSSNLNHRSLIHDLEADVVLVGDESCSRLVQQFYRDLERAEEVKQGSSELPWYFRLCARLLLLFKFVL